MLISEFKPYQSIDSYCLTKTFINQFRLSNLSLSYNLKYVFISKIVNEHLMLRNNQQPTCRNAACENQSLTIKHSLKDCPNGGTAARNTYKDV